MKSEKEIYFQENAAPFLKISANKVDVCYHIDTFSDAFEYCYKEKICKGDMVVSKTSNGYVRARLITEGNKKFYVFLLPDEVYGNYNLLYEENYAHNGKIFENANILNYLAIEEVCLRHHAFILHSSLICWRGKGILFTAPSGTGKSTQADLWYTFEQAEIYNGDRAIIRKIDGVFYGFGSPYAGSSGIYRNESAPVCAIIVLTQAPENRIERLKGKDAFLPLYRETLMNTWNPDYMERMTDLLMDAAANIPVYHLACRPDRDAVELVKSIVF